MDLLEVSLLDKTMSGLASKLQKEMAVQSRENKSLLAQKKYDTPEIEFKRNIAFLLTKGIIGLENEIGSDRGTHSLYVFPVPAMDQQIVYFELKTDGKISVEIISRDGKVLKNVFSGKLNAGQHDMKVNISNIQSDVFFTPPRTNLSCPSSFSLTPSSGYTDRHPVAPTYCQARQRKTPICQVGQYRLELR